MISATTTAIATRIVGVRLLLVLARCRSRLHSGQRDVASTYVFFDMPAICSDS